MARQPRGWRGRPKAALPGAATVPSLGGGCEAVEGDDVENEAVLEQHRLGAQMGLLGQGSPEGYVDHEFPPKPRSIDGLDGPPAKKGQEALMDLISAPRQAEDDDDELAPLDAPFCHCGRRSRCNRVRIPGAACGRPYFRCGGRSCRFLSFGEQPSSPQAQRLRWLRFETGRGDRRHVVVGSEGFRPEDARLGAEVDAESTAFVDAVAVLAERPGLLQRLLPNARPGGCERSGCHEVRLCVGGRWRAHLIDEHLPVLEGGGGSSSSTAGPRAQEELAFGRSAGNQIWLALLEKAYAKAFGAYNFALVGARLDEVLADLSGAAVENLSLRQDGADLEALWARLRDLAASTALAACTSRPGAGGRSTVHALLDVSEDDVGARAVRLRNPRTGFHTGANAKEVVGQLRGTPAEGSSHSDGSFWVQFPEDFLAGFARLDVCHAGAADQHARVFEGEFTPNRALGVRGCAVRLAADGGPAACFLTVAQPLPHGARLLRPALGQVLNDLGVVVLRADDLSLHALALGGAWPEVTCRVDLEPGAEYLVLPLSFRAWPGPALLRVRAAAPLRARPAPSEPLAWHCWRALLGTPRPPPGGALRAYPLGEGTSVDVVVLELDGAVLVVARNLHPQHAALVECKMNASHMGMHTSRGFQFGAWLADANAVKASWDAKPDWRSYVAEDLVPPDSRQLLCALFGVALGAWEFDFLSGRATAMPAASAARRPPSHAFAPQPSAGGAPPAEGAEVAEEDDEDEALRLAIELSLAEAGGSEAVAGASSPSAAVGSAAEGGAARGGRWTRRARQQAEAAAPMAAAMPPPTRPTAVAALLRGPCAVCAEEAGAPAAPLSCCGRRVCAPCARRWATMQAKELGAWEIHCTVCSRTLLDDELPALLDSASLIRVRERARERQAAGGGSPPTEEALGVSARALARLGVKRCPECGTGMSREVESCHKMICRTCRARFCFRCLSRLEYFNCGCTGSEHRFVDPVDGRVIAHQ